MCLSNNFFPLSVVYNYFPTNDKYTLYTLPISRKCFIQLCITRGKMAEGWKENCKNTYNCRRISSLRKTDSSVFFFPRENVIFQWSEFFYSVDEDTEMPVKNYTLVSHKQFAVAIYPV